MDTPRPIGLKRIAHRILLFASVWGLCGCVTLPTVVAFHDPLSASEHVALGNAYAAHQDMRLATREYEAALHQDGRCIPALMALGNRAFDEQHWRKAGGYFQRVLRIHSNDPAAANNLAMVYLGENKHLDRADALINQALPVAGALAPYLWDTRANIALRQRRYSDAKKDLDQAATLAPVNNTDFQRQLQNSRHLLTESAAISSPAMPR